MFFDPKFEIPAWLEVSSLSDLKEDLLAVTIVLLGISFLGRAVQWESDEYIIYFGVAIGVVLIPLVAMFAVLFFVNSVEARELRSVEEESSNSPPTGGEQHAQE